MNYWPGTNILKSQNNDFDWRNKDSDFTWSWREFVRQSKAGSMGGQVTRQQEAERTGYMTPVEKPYQKTITAFSKAKPTKFNGKGDKV